MRLTHDAFVLLSLFLYSGRDLSTPTLSSHCKEAQQCRSSSGQHCLEQNQHLSPYCLDYDEVAAQGKPLGTLAQSNESQRNHAQIISPKNADKRNTEI